MKPDENDVFTISLKSVQYKIHQIVNQISLEK